MMGGCYGVLWMRAVGQEQRGRYQAPQLALATVLKGWAGTLIYFAATLVAFVAPKISALMFIAVAFYYLMPGRVESIPDSPKADAS